MERKIKRFIRMNKTLVIYTSLFLVGCAGLFIGLIPSIQKAIALYREVASLQTEVNKIQEKASMLSGIDQAGLENTVEQVLAAIPSDKSVTTLMATVEAVAGKSNLVVTDMSIEGIGSLASGSAKLATKPEGNTLTEIVTFQGELPQFRNFLADAIRVRRLMRIKSLELTAIPKSTMMNMKLAVEVFYSPLPASIGKATDSLPPLTPKELETLEKLDRYPIAYSISVPEVAQVTAGTPVREAPTVPVLTDPFSTDNVKKVPVSVSPTPVQVQSTPTQGISPTPTRVATSTATPRPTALPTVTPGP